jgi:hypothetical protein
MAGLIWVTDREPGVRHLLGELMPDAEVLNEDELNGRLALGTLPDGLVIDGTQLLELSARGRDAVLAVPRVLICTGLALGGLPPWLMSGPGVAVLAKPFCVEDLEAAIEWLRGEPVILDPDALASLPVQPELAGVIVAASRRRRPERPTAG